MSSFPPLLPPLTPRSGQDCLSSPLLCLPVCLSVLSPCVASIPPIPPESNHLANFFTKGVPLFAHHKWHSRYSISLLFLCRRNSPRCCCSALFVRLSRRQPCPPQAAPLLGSRVNHDATYKLQPTIETHSRGINAVNSAPSFKVTAILAKRDTQRRRKKTSSLVAAAWNQQRAEVENVVVNGIQVVKTKGGDGVG